MLCFLIRIIDSSTIFHVGPGFPCTTHSSDCSRLPGLQIVQTMEKDNKVSLLVGQCINSYQSMYNAHRSEQSDSVPVQAMPYEVVNMSSTQTTPNSTMVTTKNQPSSHIKKFLCKHGYTGG